MIGAVIGDIAGSVYEFSNKKPLLKNIISSECFFTDDSILSIAVADALIYMKKNGFKNSASIYRLYLLEYARKYKDAGYGKRFHAWFNSKNPQAYNSYGNGSAMRTGAVGYAFDTLEKTLSEAAEAASVTHNHPDGIAGAEAVAGSIFLARSGSSKETIKEFIEKEIGYPIKFNLKELHKNYKFEIACKNTVPQAVFAFLISDSFEDAIKKAVYIGGDTDTLACITGAIAEAFYKKIPKELIRQAEDKIGKTLFATVKEFQQLFDWEI
ncbi:ADP-ribosylglycohydrolase family protein [Treponema pedis]|uniref:ADP-ribosylglycohydrolase family protein n=1 Tax=Treponema pedis TaxID=409322 RepID=A0A7S6WNM5_9SPIR|nr:ADP-ribosylglycohydrolase family protein [Treponema pedis]QOW60431.1 ADP-ribosylglycohydrolase family protein [Treponema pedis]